MDGLSVLLGIPNYLGCIAKNQLPSHRVYGWYIVNLQSENEGDGRGTHWVYVGVQPPFATYFDSFGQPMPEVVARFLVGLRVFENHEIYQSLSSHMCGWLLLLVVVVVVVVVVVFCLCLLLLLLFLLLSSWLLL